MKCSKGTATPVGKAYAGSNGVEVCSDDNKAADGRIIVDFSKRYASADGDSSNPGQANGYIRVDQKGPRCGDKDSTSAKDARSCDPR